MRSGDDVVIVGAGFTGLAAALELTARGVSCRILESESVIGGLAAGFEVGGGRLERFYHHWFASDREMFDLCAEVGLGDRVMQHLSRTGLYYANAMFRLTEPIDVLRFTPLPFADRIRLGLLAVRARRVRDWRSLESRTAEQWLVELGGRRVYEVVWRPLLEGKFGEYAGRVGATWMWTKLALRGGSRTRGGRETLSYVRGGCDVLLDALRDRLLAAGVRIHTGTAAEEVVSDEYGVQGVRAGGRFFPARRVLLTVASPVAAGLLGDSATGHPAVPGLRRRLNSITYLANVCLVLQNRRPLSETYWINVNDPSFPYVGVIEHTNLEDPARYGGRHIVYLSKYLPADAPLYRMSDEEVFEHSLPHLKRMFPAFDRDWVAGYHVWRAPYAQPVVTPHYARALPGFASRVPGLYLAGMAHVFPEDRGTNYAVRDGRRVARMMADARASDHERDLPQPMSPNGGRHG
ncbi:NAD(P)/FAD-dependent oxidoreductase [Actinoplanes sp. CA-252034]|uniref:NAD(P)/FAD-dependent oxidoreductase n=1 Tax=Actinoplanes sp. CA-252034 TaxID=3239906 RepID=UPI003D99BF18